MVLMVRIIPYRGFDCQWGCANASVPALFLFLSPEESLENAEGLSAATAIVARGVAMRITIGASGRGPDLPTVVVVVFPALVLPKILAVSVRIAIPHVAAYAPPV